MLKWFRSIDWAAIFGSALVLVLALWFLNAHPDYEPNPATYKDPLEYTVGVLRFIFGLLPPDGWTALFTAALFFSTMALWGVTRTAALAAKAAADALPIVERAYLFPNGPIPVKIDWPHTRSDNRFGEFSLVIRNHGKTPAIMRQIFFGVIPLAMNEPNVADLDKATNVLNIITPALLAGGATSPLIGRFAVSGENVLTLSGDSTLFSFFLIGRIFYDDIFGSPHETVFCRVCGVLGRDENFNTIGPDQLNYHT